MDRYRWRDLAARPVVFPAIGLVGGASILGPTCLNSGLFLPGAGLLALLALALSWRRSRAGNHLLVLAAFVLTGAGLSTLEARVEVPLPTEPTSSTPTRLEGVVEASEGADQGCRITLAVARTHGAPGDSAPSPAARFRAQLSSRRGPCPLPGQRIRLETTLKRVLPPANWGEADRYDEALRTALLYRGAFDPERVLTLTPAAEWRRWVEGVRAGLAAKVAQLAPTPESGALYLTLAAGLRAELADPVEEAFARSGLAHVLSVSGLHVAALALLTLGALRWLATRTLRSRTVEPRRWVAPLCIPLLWAYVVFTGSQPPAIRSAVMATLLLVGLALWRRADPLNGAALAAIGLVAWSPGSVAGLSLQLSFLAVLALLLLTPALRGLVPVAPPDPSTDVEWRFRAQRLRETALRSLCASAAVTLGGLPLIASAFHRLSLAGLIANLICMPLCALLTGLAAGGAAVFALAPWASVPLLVAGTWASRLLLGCAEVLGGLPGAAVPLPSLGGVEAAVYFAGLGAFALGTGRVRWAGLLAPAVLAFVLLRPALLPAPALAVTFLSVGHGDAVVVSAAGHHALIDGGGVPGGADTGRRFVLPFLREQGISALDLAVLSHPHPDHALGLISTLAELPTARLWLPPVDEEGEAPDSLSAQVIRAAGAATVEHVERGHAPFSLGGATVEVLGPPADRILLRGVNDRSVALRIRYRDVSVLLAGDLEADGEAALLSGDTDAAPVTILKAPHHGSGTSSTVDWVDRLRPRFVVFCVGAQSRFHFPAADVVERYDAVGARCLRTDLDGAVRFETDGKDVRLETYRSTHPVSDRTEG